MIGKCFGRLTVMDRADPYITPAGVKVKRWLCKCVCGNYSKVITSALKTTKSCGCFQKEKAAIACRDNFTKTEEEILSNKVIIKRGLATPCWEWSGKKHRSGYAHTTRKGKHKSLHRLSYEYFKGAVPEEMEVCHKCHNKSCFNPEHLIVGTHKQNVSMSSTEGRYNIPRKIDISTAKVIKNMLSEGFSNTEIVRNTQAPYTVVVDIRRGKSWKHI